MKVRVNQWKSDSEKEKLETKIKEMKHNTNELKQHFSKILSSATDKFKQSLHEKDAELEAQKRKEISDIVAKHESQIKKLRRGQYYLQTNNKYLKMQLNSIDINYFVNRALKYVRFEKRAALVLDLVMSGDMFGAKGQEGGKEFIQKDVQKTFTAWRLCQAKDTAHQGCLNLQGIAAVHQIEELEEREQGMMPSKSSIWQEGDKILKNVGYSLFQPVQIENDFGEAVLLNV